MIDYPEQSLLNVDESRSLSILEAGGETPCEDTPALSPAEGLAPAGQAGGEPAVEHGQENGNQTASPEAPSWHAEAGRKGARRVHQLIQEGKLYEQEHGLKRGRQRLRQLIAEGKLYEREHGLKGQNPEGKTDRYARMSSRQLLQSLGQILVRLAKPSYRGDLVRMLRALENQDGETV